MKLKEKKSLYPTLFLKAKKKCENKR